MLEFSLILKDSHFDELLFGFKFWTYLKTASVKECLYMSNLELFAKLSKKASMFFEDIHNTIKVHIEGNPEVESESEEEEEDQNTLNATDLQGLANLLSLVQNNQKQEVQEEEEEEVKAEPPKRKKKSVDSEAPKKPLTSFFQYSRDVTPELKKQNPQLNITEIAKLVGARWKSLPQIERDRYKQQYDAKHAQYLKEMKDYSEGKNKSPNSIFGYTNQNNDVILPDSLEEGKEETNVEMQNIDQTQGLSTDINTANQTANVSLSFDNINIPPNLTN